MISWGQPPPQASSLALKQTSSPGRSVTHKHVCFNSSVPSPCKYPGSPRPTREPAGNTVGIALRGAPVYQLDPRQQVRVPTNAVQGGSALRGVERRGAGQEAKRLVSETAWRGCHACGYGHGEQLLAPINVAASTEEHRRTGLHGALLEAAPSNNAS